MVRFIGRSVHSLKVVEDFLDVHFSCVMVGGRVVDSNMNGFTIFSGNLFAVLVYYLEMGDVGSRVVVGNALFVNCTDSMTIAFLHPIFQASAGFSYLRKVTVFFWEGSIVDYVWFRCDGILSLGGIRIDLRLLAPLR